MYFMRPMCKRQKDTVKKSSRWLRNENLITCRILDIGDWTIFNIQYPISLPQVISSSSLNTKYMSKNMYPTKYLHKQRLGRLKSPRKNGHTDPSLIISIVTKTIKDHLMTFRTHTNWYTIFLRAWIGYWQRWKNDMEQSKRIRIGIMPQEKIRERMLDIAAGKYKPAPDEPQIWFTSMRSLAEVLSDENRALLCENDSIN